MVDRLWWKYAVMGIGCGGNGVVMEMGCSGNRL